MALPTYQLPPFLAAPCKFEELSSCFGKRYYYPFFQRTAKCLVRLTPFFTLQFTCGAAQQSKQSSHEGYISAFSPSRGIVTTRTWQFSPVQWLPIYHALLQRNKLIAKPLTMHNNSIGHSAVVKNSRKPTCEQQTASPLKVRPNVLEKLITLFFSFTISDQSKNIVQSKTHAKRHSQYTEAIEGVTSREAVQRRERQSNSSTVRLNSKIITRCFFFLLRYCQELSG